MTMRDLRSTLRLWQRHPWFAGLAMATLALGIAANVAVVGFLDRVFWRSLPVPRPNELVMLKYQRESGGVDDSFIAPVYAAFRSRSEVFSGLAAYWGVLAECEMRGSNRRVVGLAVSDNYFAILGVSPVLGRAFLRGEDRDPGAHPVAMISHELWKSAWGGDPEVVGRGLRLNGVPLTIVGVTPPGFTGTYAGTGAGFYVPLGTWAFLKGIDLEARDYDWLRLMGRLRPGVSREQAQAAMRVFAGQLHRAEPRNTPTQVFLTEGRRGTNPWADEDQWWPLALLQAVALMLLIVACANVAGILLAQGVSRQRELAVRAALGADRWDLLRRVLLEGLLLAVAGGVGGLLLGRGLMEAVRWAVPMAGVVNIPVGMDGRLILFGMAFVLATALGCGLLPALRSSRPDLVSALNEETAFLPLVGRRWGLGRGLVVVQVAVTLVVLAVGALCLRSLALLRVVDPGFESSRLLVVSVDRGSRRGDEREGFRRLAEWRDRLVAMPGIEAAALCSRVPLSEGGRSKTITQRIEGYAMPAGEEQVSWEYERVGPEYFGALGVRVVRGRDFGPEDHAGAPKVMIINELLAERFWPDQDPLGRLVFFQGEVRQVIGVVPSFRLHSLREAPRPMSFWPLAQPLPGQSETPSSPVLLVRTEGPPGAIASFLRSELDGADAGWDGVEVSPLSDRLATLLMPQQMIGGLLNLLGGMGLLFAGLGVFGVMAHEVARRTREVGLRMALGARYGQILGWVLGRGAAVTSLGLALGLVLSVVPVVAIEAFLPEIRQADRYFLYGVRPWDPVTFGLAATVVMTVALAACWIPARRAARVAPMVALRHG